jgi:hypothetical protein
VLLNEGALVLEFFEAVRHEKLAGAGGETRRGAGQQKRSPVWAAFES